MEIKINESTTPRGLLINNQLICDGGNYKVGLYASGSTLFFDGNIVTTSDISSIGLVNTGVDVLFNGRSLLETIEPPIDESGYWNVPVMAASSFNTKNYAGYIADYDELVSIAPNYVSKHRYEVNGQPVLTKNGNYEMFSYHFTPENYTKTIFIQAGIHGNEMDSKQQLLRLCQILVKDINNSKYKPLQDIRNNCRLIVIPIVSPYGHDNSSMNVPYDTSQYGINLNRNYDFNQQTSLASVGVGGAYPYEYAEVRHTRDVLLYIGLHNIDYAFDWHDGGNVYQHYWINYCADGGNPTIVNNFVAHLINKYNISNPVIDNCKDTGTTGTASGYMYATLGLEASVVEWIGGYLGYNFDESQMTQSFEIRANMLLLAYKADIKGWRINEQPNANWFRWDYPMAITRSNLRLEGAGAETKVSDGMIYKRWDDLLAKSGGYIRKSSELGKDCTGTTPIHTYTIGNGATKVLYVGGIMRFGGNRKIDEYAMYLIAEYLCNDDVVSQSKFLQNLRNNYTIIVLPCIDNIASNSEYYREAGLNNTTLSRERWFIDSDNKTKPTIGVHGSENHGVKIIKGIIDSNTDIKCIVSGGEIMGGYALNPPDYTTDFEMQIVIPRNCSKDGISNYAQYLASDRNEKVSIENTKGFTFCDYAYDHYNIPCYYAQLNVSKKYAERSSLMTVTSEAYLYRNYESGRRMANIINLFLL